MNEPADFLLFLGRFHPLVLHFPIVLVLLSAVIEGYRRISGTTKLDLAAWIMVVAATATAVLTVALGLLLSQDPAYASETLDWHRAFGISVAVIMVIALALKVGIARRSSSTAGSMVGSTAEKEAGHMRGHRTRPLLSNVYGTALTAAVLAVFTAGHYGGHLTHGSTYLTAYAPFGIGDADGDAMDTRAAGVFATRVEPVLTQYCISCHGKSKQSGGLRLDSAQAAFEGGNSAQAIVAGSAMESELVRRLLIDRSHKQAMPPNGKSRPAADDIMAVIDWIEAGANWGDEAQGPSRLVADLLGEGVTPLPADAYETFAQAGVRLQPLSKDNELLAADFKAATLDAPEIAALISRVADHLTWVDLSGQTVGEDVFAALSEAPKLTRLHLANTNTGDGDLKRLKELDHLVSVNLVGTNVTSKGVRSLKAIPGLTTVYLWDSKVAEADLEGLRKAFPDASLLSGSSLRSIEGAQ